MAAPLIVPAFISAIDLAALSRLECVHDVNELCAGCVRRWLNGWHLVASDPSALIDNLQRY